MLANDFVPTEGGTTLNTREKLLVKRHIRELTDGSTTTLHAHASGGSGGTLVFTTQFGHDSEFSAADSGSAFAFKGHSVVPNTNVTVHMLAAPINTTACRVYKAVIGAVDACNVITSITSSTTVTATSPLADGTMIPFKFSCGVALTAGTRYFLMVGHTCCGLCSTALNVPFSVANVKENMAFDTRGNLVTARIADRAPAVCDTICTNGCDTSGVPMFVGWSYTC